MAVAVGGTTERAARVFSGRWMLAQLFSFEAAFVLFLYSNEIKVLLPTLPIDETVLFGGLSMAIGAWLIWRDGIYLPGFPVAKVVNVERDSAYSFARIFCVPIAGVENFGEVMVLSPRQALPERPPETAGRAATNDGQRVKKKRMVKN